MEVSSSSRVLILMGYSLTLYMLLGWTLLATSSASILLPSPEAARDRIQFALFSPWSTLKGFVFCKVVLHYTLVLPLAAILWTVDELVYPEYKRIVFQESIICISVPRAGTTTFHRMLALDDRFVTPTMLELFLPFLCVQKVVWGIHHRSPAIIQRIENILKWANGVTAETDARHPVHLLAPDADDILLGEWHWVSVGSIRTFPVAIHWKKHYLMENNNMTDRSILLHSKLCQKVLLNRGGPDKRLLLRSHLSPCIAALQQIHINPVFVGILRDPVAILQSFAGLAQVTVQAATGVDILKVNNREIWSSLFVDILSDMMGREAELYGTGRTDPFFVNFDDFMANKLASLETLYKQIGLPFEDQMKEAVLKRMHKYMSYKTRHVYSNPTLQELGIKEQTFNNLPNVISYKKLFCRK